MISKFLKTKIGVALVISLLFIAVAIVIKIRNSAPALDIQRQVGIIADASVTNALKSGAPSNLDVIFGTSTIDDKIAELKSDAASSTPENLTATDRFSRLFFQRFIDLKKSGLPIDENTGMNLVNELLSEDYGSSIEEKVYGESDVKVLTTYSPLDLKQYGNALGAIINEPLPKGYEQELSIVARVSDTGSSEELKKLALNIAHYASLRDKILTLPVPNPLKAAHVALINSISAVLEGVRGMTIIESDPVGATKMIARYQDGMDSVSLPLQYMKTYLEKQNVSFSSRESGYILMQ